MPLRQVHEELEKLERYRDSLSHGPERHSCEIAELHLRQYLLEFEEFYERSVRRIRLDLRNTKSKERFDRDYAHPKLFINGKPVLKLFLFNIRVPAGRRQIARLLADLGASSVKIGRVYSRSYNTTALLDAGDLGMSCMLQTRSCLNKIKWTYRKGEPSSVRVVPSLYDEREERQEPAVGHRPLAFLITQVMHCLEAVTLITKDMTAGEFMRFYRAMDHPESFSGLGIHFDASLERYTGEGAHLRMFEDAGRFRFVSAIIRNDVTQIDAGILERILRTQSERNLNFKVSLEVLDITAIEATVEVV